jgi:hypothetical protein
MALPILATVEDVDALVTYLKTKAAGASVADAKKVVRKQVLDGRKIAAFLSWGIIKRDGETIKLDERGWHLARNSRPRPNVFQSILKSVKPYHSALEWACHNNLPEVTSTDVGAHWHEHFPEELGTDDERGISAKVACFFGICQAANLGKFTIGRRGQPTRLALNRDNLELFIGVTVPESQPETVEEEQDHTEDTSGEKFEENERDEIPASPPAGVDALTDIHDANAENNEPIPSDVRVFISHGKNMDLVEQVETMLGVAEVPYEIAVSEETSAIPVPEKVFNSMRRCNAAIIVVSAEDENADGNLLINQNVLIEIGAAFVLYNKKVILLWDKRLPVPSNLQGLYRSEFEGDELSWKAGMKLMKAIKDFRHK